MKTKKKIDLESFKRVESNDVKGGYYRFEMMWKAGQGCIGGTVGCW